MPFGVLYRCRPSTRAIKLWHGMSATRNQLERATCLRFKAIQELHIHGLEFMLHVILLDRLDDPLRTKDPLEEFRYSPPKLIRGVEDEHANVIHVAKVARHARQVDCLTLTATLFFQFQSNVGSLPGAACGVSQTIKVGCALALWSLDAYTTRSKVCQMPLVSPIQAIKRATGLWCRIRNK